MNEREGAQREPRERRSPAARLVGFGTRSAGRLAEATGVDVAVEDAIEEAIVRALRSPAVERALVRVIERNAVQDAIQRALTSEEVAEAVVTALDSQLAGRVWEEILASAKAQMLVERIAEAPEVRAAIAEQGAGLITDVGRRLTKITEALDDSAERLAHRIVGRSGEETETDQVGLVTRTLAAGVDLPCRWRCSRSPWDWCGSCSRRRAAAGTTTSLGRRWSTTPGPSSRRGRSRSAVRARRSSTSGIAGRGPLVDQRPSAHVDGGGGHRPRLVGGDESGDVADLLQ
ncbi:MAG: hypothetical protein ACRDK9_09665 [Solirubrobacterales bacterium]